MVYFVLWRKKYFSIDLSALHIYKKINSGRFPGAIIKQLLW